MITEIPYEICYTNEPLSLQYLKNPTSSYTVKVITKDGNFRICRYKIIKVLEHRIATTEGKTNQYYYYRLDLRTAKGVEVYGLPEEKKKIAYKLKSCKHNWKMDDLKINGWCKKCGTKKHFFVLNKADKPVWGYTIPSNRYERRRV